MPEERLVEGRCSGTRSSDEEEVGPEFPDRFAIAAVSAITRRGWRYEGGVARRNSDFKPRLARETIDRLDSSRLLSQSLNVSR